MMSFIESGDRSGARAAIAIATLLGLSICAAIAAGPAEAQLMVFHASGLSYTSDGGGDFAGQSGIACGQDGPPSAQACPPYDPIGGAFPCDENAGVRFSMLEPGAWQVWYLLASFPQFTCPRIKTVAFGVNYDAARLKVVAWGPCDPAAGVTQEFKRNQSGNAFPAPGSGVQVTWGETRTSALQELYWFAGYAFAQYPNVQFEFVDGDSIAARLVDDQNPPGETFVWNDFPLVLNWSDSGETAYACCKPSGVCVLKTLDECTIDGGTSYNRFSCVPSPCAVSPAEETSWGRIKFGYR